MESNRWHIQQHITVLNKDGALLPMLTVERMSESSTIVVAVQVSICKVRRNTMRSLARLMGAMRTVDLVAIG